MMKTNQQNQHIVAWSCQQQAVMVTDRSGEVSCSLDVKQLLVDDLQVLSAPLTGAKHREEHRCTQKLCLKMQVWGENPTERTL